ncbi:uncharacterized protein LOC142228593 [Haematobia irritans]|uniref:uncharacterized protein LOC142228593 n=1 Tax=Haematobia irritans TaxID=7368 RepID=UPI003F4F74CB
MESEQIISEVKKRPVIWDTTAECYKNKTMKMNAWLDVAASIKPNFKTMSKAEQKYVVHDLTMKWRSIRDNYVRYKKRMSESTSRSGGCMRSYIHAKQLRFLNKSLKESSSPTSSAASAANSNDFTDPMELVQTHLVALDTVPGFTIYEEEDNDTTTCSYSLPPVTISKFENPVKPLEQSTVPVISGVSTLSLSLEEKLCKFMEDHQSKESDEDMLFFKSLLPRIKVLNGDDKLEFRIKTLQLLQDLKKRHENTTLVNGTTHDDVKIKQEP